MSLVLYYDDTTGEPVYAPGQSPEDDAQGVAGDPTTTVAKAQAQGQSKNKTKFSGYFTRKLFRDPKDGKIKVMYVDTRTGKEVSQKQYERGKLIENTNVANGVFNSGGKKNKNDATAQETDTANAAFDSQHYRSDSRDYVDPNDFAPSNATKTTGKTTSSTTSETAKTTSVDSIPQTVNQPNTASDSIYDSTLSEDSRTGNVTTSHATAAIGNNVRTSGVRASTSSNWSDEDRRNIGITLAGEVPKSATDAEFGGVIATIDNRAVSTNKSIYDTVTAPKQYSMYNDPDVKNRAIANYEANKDFYDSKVDMYASDPGSYNQGQTHYFNKDLVDPKWSSAMKDTVDFADGHRLGRIPGEYENPASTASVDDGSKPFTGLPADQEERNAIRNEAIRTGVLANSDMGWVKDAAGSAPYKTDTGTYGTGIAGTPPTIQNLGKPNLSPTQPVDLTGDASGSIPGYRENRGFSSAQFQPGQATATNYGGPPDQYAFGTNVSTDPNAVKGPATNGFADMAQAGMVNNIGITPDAMAQGQSIAGQAPESLAAQQNRATADGGVTAASVGMGDRAITTNAGIDGYSPGFSDNPGFDGFGSDPNTAQSGATSDSGYGGFTNDTPTTSVGIGFSSNPTDSSVDNSPEDRDSTTDTTNGGIGGWDGWI